MSELPDHFSTSDLSLAAFLLARGYLLQEPRLSNGQVAFCFTHDAAIVDAVRDFWNNLAIPIQDYLRSLDTCRDIIRQQRQGEVR